MQGQMHTVSNAVRERRHIQFTHLVLQPASIDIAIWLGDLDLAHHLGCGGLLLLEAVSIVFGFEATQIHPDVLFRHRKALVSEKLFNGVDIDSLLDHIGGDGMPELMRSHQVWLPFVGEVRSQFFESILYSSAGEDAFLHPKQVVCVKVIWKLLGPLLLTMNGINHAVGFSCWDTMIAFHFGIGGINTNPLVALRILVEASLLAVRVGCFEMGHILKTHAGMT